MAEPHGNCSKRCRHLPSHDSASFQHPARNPTINRIRPGRTLSPVNHNPADPTAYTYPLANQIHRAGMMLLRPAIRIRCHAGTERYRDAKPRDHYQGHSGTPVIGERGGSVHSRTLQGRQSSPGHLPPLVSYKQGNALIKAQPIRLLASNWGKSTPPKMQSRRHRSVSSSRTCCVLPNSQKSLDRPRLSQWKAGSIARSISDRSGVADPERLQRLTDNRRSSRHSAACNHRTKTGLSETLRGRPVVTKQDQAGRV